MSMVFAVVLAFAISLFGTPLIRKLAIRFGAFAPSNNRTVHRRDVPILGGLIIFLAFSCGLIVLNFEMSLQRSIFGMLLGGGLIAIIGFVDDLYALSCYKKLLGQTLAAVLAAFNGFALEGVFLPFFGNVELGPFGFLFSVLWILMVVNAVNLLDGLDGLASSITILIASVAAFGAFVLNNHTTVVFAALLVASILGFLRYNLPPAKIFMGDTGSLFIGFVLACISVKAFVVDSAVLHMPSMLVLFSVPFVDTILAVVRRLAQKKHPFTPDKEHIHHRLLERGLNHLSAVLVLSTATVICGLLGLSFVNSNSNQIFVWFLTLGLCISACLWQLGCFDFLEERYVVKELKESSTIRERNVEKTDLNITSPRTSYPSSSVRSSAVQRKLFVKRKSRTPA